MDQVASGLPLSGIPSILKMAWDRLGDIPGLGSIDVLANGSSTYPKAPENGTDASPCLPVFKNFSDISHREPPSCYRLNLLISKAEPMMIYIWFRCTQGVNLPKIGGGK